MAKVALEHPAVRETPGLVSWPEIKRHLDLYSAALDEGRGRLALFILPQAITFASDDIRKIADHAVTQARAGRDVYLHIHLHDLPEGELARRGSIETTRASIGLFADIDCVGPGRKRPAHTLCGSLHDATWVLDQFVQIYGPLRFSLVVRSGYGVYPAVLFKEPFVIESADDRKRLENLSRRFHAALQTIASGRGWTGSVDFCDIGKVLRFPGVVNWKDPAAPKGVSLLWDTDARFNPGELEEILPQPGAREQLTIPGGGVAEQPVFEVGRIILDMGVEIPPMFLAGLRENHPMFGPTWDDNRPDMPDQSCSGYDLSLANIGVAGGLTDQQIADLLIAHRAKFPGPKQERRGEAYVQYLRRTIRTARVGKQSSAAAERDWAEFQAAIDTPLPAGTADQAGEPAAGEQRNGNPDADPPQAQGGEGATTTGEPHANTDTGPQPPPKRPGPREATVLTPEQACAELYALLAAAEDTGKAGPLFEAADALAAISEGQFSDLIGAVKKAVAESTNGLHIDLNLLRKARRLAQESSRKSTETKQRSALAEQTGKLTIIVSNKQLSNLRAEAVTALLQGNDPPVVFQRLRESVRFRVDATNDPFLETFNWISMRSRLADRAHFLRRTDTGDLVGVFPPRPLCEEILAYDHPPGTFPTVEAIARTPIVRPDGSIFATAGYDPSSRMIYVPPAGFVLPPVPENPTGEDIRVAKERLLDVVVDFPFEESADQTNFLGFALTPLIRQLADVVPMCAFDSPVSGSGKGLLTDVASIVAMGEVAAVIASPTTREEWPKLLFSLLDAGRTFIVFDNLQGVLQSDALEAVLTKPLFQSRVLGLSQERVVPNRATWAVTGNQIALSRDMVRRVYRVRIDPRCAQPHLRKEFKHPNLVEYCKTERPALLAALLVLVRAWFAAGKPAAGGAPLGTYTTWREIVGGILRNVGFDDFLGNQRKLYAEMDQESEEWETWLLQIEAQFRDADFAVSQLVPLIHKGGKEGFSLPREVAKIYGQTVTHTGSKPNALFGVQLGNIFRARRGTRFGSSEVYLDHSAKDRHAKVALYRIRRGSGK